MSTQTLAGKVNAYLGRVAEAQADGTPRPAQRRRIVAGLEELAGALRVHPDASAREMASRVAQVADRLRES